MDGKIKLDIFGKVININPENYIVTLEKLSDDCVSIIHTGQGRNIKTTPIFTVKDYGKTADEFIKEFDTQNYHAWADSKKANKIEVYFTAKELGGDEMKLSVSKAINYCEKTDLSLYSLNEEKTELIVIRKIKNSDFSDYKGDNPNEGCVGINIFTEEVTIAIDKNSEEILNKKETFSLFPIEISVIEFEKKPFSEKLEIIKNK